MSKIFPPFKRRGEVGCGRFFSWEKGELGALAVYPSRRKFLLAQAFQPVPAQAKACGYIFAVYLSKVILLSGCLVSYE
jgi:hypothetical protein